ncbi:acetamidase/formamidase family protein [Paracraurococcus ruber]|uniref:Amidase n=1 Tax=Paracraurococcus ruber TaxID=77675 RepID=A0ABS1D3K3_9PROT|nr:acetamidase/formamidase family protein [Paracraurococcus ruber]MBK1661026.1 amidase [Paracraurococcus ruber]TDG26788.1 amidase [Paracraurococcus ruber]
MPAHHEIPATPESMIWGTLDARTPPALTVDSGDEVTIATVPAGGLPGFPTDGTPVPEEYRLAVEKLPQGPGAHFVNRPVFVRGAMPGDVLQVDILSAEPWMDWGFTCVLPLLGTLPEEFPEPEHIHPKIDHARGVCTLPWGTEIPLDPFFGVMGTCPPPHWGACTTNVPRAFGGNMDNKELKPGTTLYLPVFNEGALFYVGDGHGVQGDGEVCISALETGLRGRFRLTVRKDLDYKVPFAETATHLISIGIDEDLDDAAKQAVREMVREVCARTNLSRNHAYMLCSLIGDLRVTQTVDGNKGVHMMLAKKYV